MTEVTEQELEYMLHDAFIFAAAKRYDKIPDTKPVLTKKYQRKFAKMLADPFAYAKKNSRPVAQQIRHYALVAALILAILTGTIFAIPQTRTIAVDLIRQWFDDGSTAFYFKGSGSSFVLPEFEINYIPRGYTLVYEDSIEGEMQVFSYENSKRQRISIDIFMAGSKFTESINTEHSKISYIELNGGIEAQLFEGESQEWSSNLVWTSNDGKIFYLINGHLSPKELIKIANSITRE